MNTEAMRPVIERHLQDIHAALGHASPDAAVAALSAMHANVGHFAEVSKARLLASPLTWSDEQKAEALWIHQTNQRVAALCLQITDELRRKVGAGDARTLQGTAFALLYMGEAMKWEIATGAPASRNYREFHGLIRHAIAGGRQLTPLRLDVGGRARACTLESLYFRALLLARFASGNLSCKQIEILDEWLWMWAPLLQSVPVPPAGAALRADLDSGAGLRLGPRKDGNPALYLPQDPLEAAFRSLVAQFHSGRIVPPEGCTAGFRIEEHVAVLDLVRRGLRATKREKTVRAVRQSMSLAVEVYLGLTEIEQRGFLAPAPRAATLALATKDGVTRTGIPIDEIYETPRRLVDLVNVSESGLGFEGSDAACEAMAVGALVGMRLSPSGPFLIGKVARRIPASTPGRIVVGVRRISADARVVEVAGDAGARRLSMVYVQGDDRNGCHDAFLVGDRDFEQGGTFEVRARENSYGFRFNRVRARGRGWVLAGFEIVSSRRGTAAAG